jgi:spore coat protein U-like protein
MIRKLLFIFATIFSGQGAFAACGLSIVASDLSLEWDLTFTAPAIAVQVSKTDPGSCTFGLGFSKGGAGSYTRALSGAGGSLSYNLYQDSGLTHVLKDVPDITSANDVVMVTLPPGNNPSNQFYYFQIPYAAATSPNLIAAGTYTDSFIINAYEGSDPTAFVNPPAVSTPVSVTVTVPKMIALALVDTGGVFQDTATTKSIDFGNISSGQVSRFDLRIRTNAGYSVKVQSTNNGKMKHVSKNSFVDYSLYVNNVLADPTGATPVLTGSGQTGLNGLGFPVKIVIGTLGNLPLAGTYKDSVIITVTVTD